MAAGSAGAATLTATYDGFTQTSGSAFNPLVTVDGNVAFVIDFDDTLGSMPGILEEIEFGTFMWINDPYGGTRNLLRTAPGVSGFIEAFRLSGGTGTSPFWTFAVSVGSSTQNLVSADSFTYRVDPDPSVIPLPPAAAMMLAGLGGLAAVRRRRNTARR
jgi:hypothetical protein